MTEETASGNRFAFWPLLPGVALTLYFCSFLRSDTFGVEIFGQGMFLILVGPLALVGLLAALIISVWQGVKAGRRRNWRRALSMMACPIFVIAALPIAVLDDHVEDQIAFRRNLPAFERTVADARDGGEHRAAKVLAIIRQSLQTMVWDDRYRAGLLPTEQTEDWRRDYETCRIIPVKDQIFVTECLLDDARKKDM